jgi:NADH-quinone oxidoreductase subunit C
MIENLNLPERCRVLVPRPSSDIPAYDCPAQNVREVLTAFRDELGYEMLVDVTAADWDQASPRFTVFYHLLNLKTHRYLRIASDCVDDENPSIPTVADIFPAANWHERETYDMFGITFEGHPDHRRILMWDSYPYFPLRKEFPLAGHEVDLPAADVEAETGARVLPAPMMGGPFVSSQTGAMSKREPRAKDQSWTEVQPKPEKQETPSLPA